MKTKSLTVKLAALLCACGLAFSAQAANVAKIGEVEYATLQGAVAAVQNGDTVTLLKNVAEAVVINSANKITLDGQGQYGIVPTSSTHTALKITASNAEVELKNITIGDKTYTQRAVNIYNAANVKLTVTNSHLYATYYALNVYNETSGNVDDVDITVTDTEIEGWAALNLWGNGGKVTVTGGKLTGNNTSSYKPGDNEFGVIVLEGLSSRNDGATNYDISITGTEIKATSLADNQGNRNEQSMVLFNPHADGNTVTLTNCTVERGQGEAAKYPLIFEETGCGENTLLVKNVTDKGTSNVTALPVSYAYQAASEGYSKVVPSVAAIYGTGYATLQAALDAISGETEEVTIELLADATLDLSRNGNVLGGPNVTKITIDGNNNTLTFVKSETWAQVNTANNAELVLNDVTLAAQNSANFAKSGYSNDLENPNHNIAFNCPVTLNNATSGTALSFFKDASLDTIAITDTNNVYSIWIHTSASTVSIKDLVVGNQDPLVTSAVRGIKVDDSFVSSHGDTPSATAITISGATFTTAKKAAVLVNSAYATAVTATGEIDISGVTKDDEHLVWVDESAADKYSLVTVTGATKAVEPIDNGYAATLSTGNIINGYYKTLADAIAAATSGDTVTLVADISLAETQTIAKDITFDLNGKTMSGEVDPIVKITGGEVTITGEGFITSVYTPVQVDAGTLMVENCTCRSTGTDISVYITSAAATVVLNGGVYETSGYTGITNYRGTLTIINSAIVSGSRYAVYNNGGTLSIENGTFNGDWYPIYNNSNGSLNIAGGVYTASYYPVFNNSGTVTISGGTFTGGDFGLVNLAGATTVSGGDFNVTGTTFYAQAGTTVSVSGGTFNKPVSSHVAPGYVQLLESGRYKVIAVDVVVNIGYVYIADIGGAAQIEATLAGEGEVVWSSSDETVATVSDSGEVTAIAIGNAIITATAPNGSYATCKVSVGGEAVIGSTVYETLEEAFSAVEAGQTVALNKDIVFEATASNAKHYTVAGGKDFTLDLNGHKIDCTGYVTASYAMIKIADGARLTIEDSTCSPGATVADGAIVYRSMTASDQGLYTIDNKGALVLNSGKVINDSTVSGILYAINDVGTNCNLTINGGLVECKAKASNAAIRAWPQSTNPANVNSVKVAGGTIHGGYYGIWFQLGNSDCYGSLNVTGGTIISDYQIVNSSEIPDAYKCWAVCVNTSAGNVNVNISGGDFTGRVGIQGVIAGLDENTYVGIDANAPRPIGTISGGTFRYCTSLGKAWYSGDETKTQVYTTWDVTGGLFVFDDPEKCLAMMAEVRGYTDTFNSYAPVAIYDDNNVLVGCKIAPCVARVGNNKYSTLEEAFEVAQATEAEKTVVLLADVELNGMLVVESGKSVVLDLNSKAITASSEWVAGVLKGDALLCAAYGGTLTITDKSNSKSGIINATTNGKPDGKLCCAVKLTHYGDDANNGTATLVVDGGTIKGTNYGISGNGMRPDTCVMVNGGKVIAIGNATDREGNAIYQPQDGSLIITGGELEGWTAVYVKSGDIEVTGGKLIGNGAATDYEFYSNGGRSTGDALVIDSCNYPGGMPTAEISGGLFLSANAEGVASYQKSDDPHFASAEGDRVVEFVSGGKFSSEVTDDCRADGYVSTFMTDGGVTLYGVVIGGCVEPDYTVLMTEEQAAEVTSSKDNIDIPAEVTDTLTEEELETYKDLLEYETSTDENTGKVKVTAKLNENALAQVGEEMIAVKPVPTGAEMEVVTTIAVQTIPGLYYGIEVSDTTDFSESTKQEVEPEMAVDASKAMNVTSIVPDTGKTKYFKVTTSATAVGAKLQSTKTFGVLKTDTPKRLEIVPVPWKGVSSDDGTIPVSEVIKTSELDNGTRIHVADGNNGYKTWELQEGRWVDTTTVSVTEPSVEQDPEPGVEASAIQLTQGGAFWVEQPADQVEEVKPIVMIGEVGDQPASKSVPAGESNLCASPKGEEFKLNEKITSADVNDSITVLDNDGNPTNYYFRDGKWKVKRYNTTTHRNEWADPEESALTIKAGTGFWYNNHSGNAKSINW